MPVVITKGMQSSYALLIRMMSMSSRTTQVSSTRVRGRRRRKKGVQKLRKELDSQPTAVSGLPPCPRHLKGRTRDVWQFLMAQYVFLPEDAPGPEDREGWVLVQAEAHLDVDAHGYGLPVFLAGSKRHFLTASIALSSKPSPSECVI
jgi:hypothetical protein